jgi:hypothetical protein
VIKTQANKINWFGLLGGILVLVVLVVSIYYPWWQLIVGENLLKVDASPLNTNFGLLDTQFTLPIIWALNVASILAFLSSGIVMAIYAVVPTKSYSKDLLSYAYRKPLYAVVFSIIGLLIATFAAKAALGIDIPLAGTSTVMLPSSLMAGIDISVLISSAFLWPFWLAIIAAGLCIAARIYHIKLSSFPKQAPAATAVVQANSAMQPVTSSQ